VVCLRKGYMGAAVNAVLDGFLVPFWGVAW